MNGRLKAPSNPIDSLVFDSAIECTQKQIEYKYSIRISVWQGAGKFKVLNPNTVTVNVSLDCFDVIWLRAKVVQNVGANFKNYSDGRLALIFP